MRWMNISKYVFSNVSFNLLFYLPGLAWLLQTTGATPAKNMANAFGALRNALTACNSCNTLEGTKRFRGAVWISARNGQRTS